MTYLKIVRFMVLGRNSLCWGISGQNICAGRVRVLFPCFLSSFFVSRGISGPTNLFQRSPGIGTCAVHYGTFLLRGDLGAHFSFFSSVLFTVHLGEEEFGAEFPCAWGRGGGGGEVYGSVLHILVHWPHLNPQVCAGKSFCRGVWGTVIVGKQAIYRGIWGHTYVNVNRPAYPW